MRAIHRLSTKHVENSKPGLLCDGGNLYLQTTLGVTGLNRSWLFRIKPRWMGLGPYPAVSLAAARAKAAEARSQRAQGIDPLAARDAQRASQAVATAKVVTFSSCVDSYVAAHQAGWTPGYAAAWESSLARYVSPIFGHLPVGEVDVGLVLKALEPIWTTMPVLAPMVRARIESVLDWARVRGYRTGENPARWKGHLDHLLPAQSKIHTVEHHPAMVYSELPGFVAELRAIPDLSARALEFLILTAARTSEVTGARWSEITGSTWVVPPARMKTRAEHRVPLSTPALKLLDKRRKLRDGEFVFPGLRGGLSRATMDSLLVRMGRDCTVHGFRSTFRDWAAETTDYPDWVAEKALAHLVGDETRRAYQRGDLLEKRRELMAAWAAFCKAPG